ncbi:MAG: hypothetical protein J6J27_04515 [Alphaproteobacteria bacterium]|nr:hypothetical protein [Alphaproteobacteria bacterium]
MINRNKELSDEEKKEIQNTLDVIDISIYDLLVKRQELKAEIENKKISISDLFADTSVSIHKISEQRKCDNNILSFTAGILNASNLLNKNIEIGIQSKKDAQNSFNRISQNINTLFSFTKSIKYKSYSKNLSIIDAIPTYPNLLASIPATKTTPKDVWWIPLLTNENKNIKIFTKLPFIETNDEVEEYLIGKINSYYGFDRSIIAIATSENITDSWLKTALHKINIPLYKIIDSTAIFNGTVLHLIEISHTIESDKDTIFSLNETLNGINIRMAGYVGGYFLPQVEKDKIVDFKFTK